MRFHIRTGMDLSRALTDQILALGVDRAVVYSTDGKWLAAVAVEEYTVRTLFAYLPGSSQFMEAKIPFGKSPSHNDFAKGSDPFFFLPNYPMPLPISAGLSRKVENGLLWMTASAPVMDMSEESGAQVGHILISAPIKEDFVRRVSGYTGTHVNLFLGG